MQVFLIISHPTYLELGQPQALCGVGLVQDGEPWLSFIRCTQAVAMVPPAPRTDIKLRTMQLCGKIWTLIRPCMHYLQ